MKILSWIIIIAGVIGGSYLSLSPGENKDQAPVSNVGSGMASPSPATVNQELNAKEVSLGEKKYNYAVIKNVPVQQVKLIPNYEKQLNTSEMLQTENCTSVINGGFYGTDYKPLGWVEISGKEISRQKTSTLFNGFVHIKNDSATISASKPEAAVLYGLQTGPVLVEDKKGVLLTPGGKNARRMVMAINTQGNLDFFAFFVAGMWTQSGPSLDELPEVLLKSAELENISINSAVNLDGGSASVFKSQGMLLPEVSPVGSWWCIK